MAITVTLYSFTKRENSTKRPSSGGTDYSCTMIDDTSLMNPIFKLEITANPIGKNYCYVSDFNRYYFITNIRTYQNFWYIECTCDVLASFKTEIGAQSHYVLRAASDYDEYICDGHYGCKISESATRLPSSGALAWGSGHSYVVGITGHGSSNSQNVGSVVYYQMDDVGLYNFLYYLMHQLSAYCDIQTAPYTDPGVQEALINPIQYIVSCIAIPVAFPSSYTEPAAISFGYYSYTIPGTGKYRILQLGETVEEKFTISLPKHPQATTRGKFMNGAPFSSYTFHLGPFGDIPLDPADYIDAEHLGYKIKYDMCQGVGRLVVGPAVIDPQIIGNFYINNVSYCGSVMVGAPVQLSQAIINPLQAQLSWETGLNNVVATGVGSGLSPATFSNLLKAQNTLQETYVDAIKNKFPSCMGKGTPGSFFSFFDSDYGCYLLFKYFTVVDENITEIGRPLCKTKQINTLTGYVLCENADAAISGTQDEAQKINGYMNSGFFYE